MYLWSSSPPSNIIRRTPSPDEDEETLAKLLRWYDTPGLLPPYSRIDPTVKQRAKQGSFISLKTVWKLGALLASKSTEMATDFVSHHIFGPKRPTWGIEMTIVSSFMRGMARHSSLANLVTLRALMQIGGMAPLPSDALVTPVTFQVKPRNLPGILQEFDQAENGRRELSGEWVVGRKLWMRLQSEWRAKRDLERMKGGIGKEEEISHDGMRMSRERVILYLHGGAYYLCSAATHRLLTIPLSKHANARVFALNYRLAPETRFPGPLHDAVLAYFRLIDDLKIPPENVLVAGDSAGGGLTLALLMYLRDHQFPLPSAAILLSPWVDLTMSCESWDSNAEFDVCPAPDPSDHLNPVYCYLGDVGVERYLTHPYASPLFGRFEGLPPLLIQSGEAEVLRDEIALLAHKATLHGVNVTHELYEDAVHVFQMLPFLPAARKAFESSRTFVIETLPKYEQNKGKTLAEFDEGKLENEIADIDKMKIVDGAGEEEVEVKDEVDKEDVKLGEGEEQLTIAVENFSDSTSNADLSLEEEQEDEEQDSNKDEMSWSYCRSRSHSRMSTFIPMSQVASVLSSPRVTKFDLGGLRRNPSMAEMQQMDEERLMEQSKKDGTSVDVSSDDDDRSSLDDSDQENRSELVRDLEERLRSALGCFSRENEVKRVAQELRRSWSSAALLGFGSRGKTAPEPSTSTLGRSKSTLLGPSPMDKMDSGTRTPIENCNSNASESRTPLPPAYGSKTPAINTGLLSPHSPSTVSIPSSPVVSRRQFSRALNPLTPMSTPTCVTPPYIQFGGGVTSSDAPSYFDSIENGDNERGSDSEALNHRQQSTFSGPYPLSPAPEASKSNMPTWRRRNRAVSHAEVTDLCRQWLNRGPANLTTSVTNELHPNPSIVKMDDASDLQMSFQP